MIAKLLHLRAAVPTNDQLAASRLGRTVLTFSLGGLTLMAVRAVRRVVEVADAIDRHGQPANAENRGPVLDVEAPTPTPEGDPTSVSPFAGDDLDSAPLDTADRPSP